LPDYLCSCVFFKKNQYFSKRITLNSKVWQEKLQETQFLQKKLANLKEQALAVDFTANV
jgi:hypothetical protein